MKTGSSATAAKSRPRGVRRRSVLRIDERGRQVTRLLDLLRALEASKYGLSVQELITQLDLGCSQRTVYRDLEHLQTAGFAVVQDGAKYRVETRSLLAEPLRGSQVLALLVAADLMAPLEASSLGHEFHTLVDSLRARLPPQGRAWLDAVRSTVAVSRRGLVNRASSQTMATVDEAIIVEQLIELEYAAPNRPVEVRRVEPHLLWCHAERPYLVAFCHKAHGFRHFALQRIRSARLLDDEFVRRPAFRPDEYVQRAFGAYHGPEHQVIIRFEPSVAHLTRERAWHPSQQVEHLETGAALLSMTVGGLPEIAAWIASFGGKAQALEPSELREQVREIHHKGLQAHQDECSRELTSGDKGGA